MNNGWQQHCAEPNPGAHLTKERVVMDLEWFRPAAFFGSIMFALVGVLVFWVCFLIIDKITPVDMWAEIVEKQNLALGVVVAAMCLGISIIVAAAIG